MLSYFGKKRFGLLLTPIEHFNYLLLDKSHWKVSPVQSKVVYYHETEAHYVIEFELTDPLYSTIVPVMHTSF